MSAKPYLKVSIFLHKLPSISHEQFFKHWATVHKDIALQNATFVKHVRKYNQVHVTFELRQAAEAFGQPLTEYDGIAEVWVDDIDAWKEIIADPEFVEKIPPDEKKFIQHPVLWQFSQDNLVIPEKK